MVVDDLPLAADAAQQEREEAAGLRAVLHREVPSSADERRVRAQGLHVQLFEAEPAHLLALRLVAAPVPLQGRLPAARERGPGLEDEVGRVPVTGHESLEVAAVPGLDLLA